MVAEEELQFEKQLDFKVFLIGLNFQEQKQTNTIKLEMPLLHILRII